MGGFYAPFYKNDVEEEVFDYEISIDMNNQDYNLRSLKF